MRPEDVRPDWVAAGVDAIPVDSGNSIPMHILNIMRAHAVRHALAAVLPLAVAEARAAGAAEMRERAAGLCEVPQWLKDVIPHVPATPAERAEYETRTNTARAIKAAIRALPLPAAPEGEG